MVKVVAAALQVVVPVVSSVDASGRGGCITMITCVVRHTLGCCFLSSCLRGFLVGHIQSWLWAWKVSFVMVLGVHAVVF